MNGLAASLAEAMAVRAALDTEPTTHRVGLCPPATLIVRMAEALKGGPVEIGGQDCHANASGAFTGSVSAEMLSDAGASLVIVGHSERRAGFGETDADVADKAAAAVRAGLSPIVCVGETLAQREAGQAATVVRSQILGSLDDSLASHDWALAYEPVWAIGTGLTPTLDQIAEIHATARAAIVERLGASGQAAQILYGGSVNPRNAMEILAVEEVGGALVGGASLKAADFLAVIAGGDGRAGEG